MLPGPPPFVLLLLALALLAPAQPARSAEDRRQEELKSLRARIDQLRQEIEQAKEDQSDAADGLRKSERRISDVNRALLQLRERERELNGRLGVLRQDIQRVREELRTQEDRLAELLRHRYEQGGQDAAQLMLGGEDPNQIARRLEYFAYIGRARAELIRAHRGNLDMLADLEARARANKSRLDAVKSQRLEQKQSLEGEKAEREKTLRALAERIRAQRGEVEALKRNEARLTRLIERLARLAKPTPPAGKPGDKPPPEGVPVERVANASVAGELFARLKGRLALPVAGEIIARFGQQRDGGGPAWKGLFIRSQAGRGVRAVASGEVVFADWLRGFGNLLIVEHGGGYLSLYSNNESLYKQPGDAIRAGDVVASVGNTGGHEDVGLYFELRHQGKPFDPLTWVAR